MGSKAEEYDFIIVGGGTSGCVLAGRLARTAAARKVLLVEGGGRNNNPALRSPDQRWSIAFRLATELGYMSVPQKQLIGQEIPCVRGRGLGGSSAINFASWLVGHKDDYNHWADEVDDAFWRWEGEKGVKERLRKLENLHLDLDSEQEKVLDRKAQEVHCAGGTIDLSFNQSWSDLDLQWFKAGKEFGMTINGDINSGDPTGFGLSPTNYCKGLRATAATAYLSSPPPNLTIKTDSAVAKVIFDDSHSKKAVGVQLFSGETFKASNDVIISAGSLDSPKILLLSGIGPANELTSLSVPVVQDLPGVGKNLRDHCLATMTLLLKAKAQVNFLTASEIQPQAASDLVIARDALRETGTQCPMAWLSSPIIKSSTEFAKLDENTRTYLAKVPSYELMGPDFPLAVGIPPLNPEDKVITLVAGVMNPQSAGSVTAFFI